MGIRNRIKDRMLGLSYEKAAPKVIKAYQNIAKFAKNKDVDYCVRQIEEAIKTKDKEMYDLNVKMLKVTLKDLGLWKKAGIREIKKLKKILKR